LVKKAGDFIDTGRTYSDRENGKNEFVSRHNPYTIDMNRKGIIIVVEDLDI